MGLEVAEGFSDSGFSKAALSLGVLLVLGFGFYVVIYTKFHSDNAQATTLEMFLTARKSVSWVTIGWSLYASAVGSGAITGPAELSYFLGLMGVFAYAIATALPVLMLGFVGPSLQKMYPSILSLSDFVKWRFGVATQILVVIITLINMSAATIAEYTTLTALYKDFVGLNDFDVFFVILVAGTTLTYTAIGGLKASIITDRAQAACSVVFVITVAIFIAVDFDRNEITQNAIENGEEPEFKFDKDLAGLNREGYEVMFTLPLSLITATIFSEAMWQRSWAAESDWAFKKGAIMGSLLVFFLVGTFGTMGFIVRWSGLVTFADIDNGFNTNLFAFQIFSAQKGKLLVDSFIGLFVLLLATTLAEGALDSLQNGIEASISGAIAPLFPESVNLKLARLLLIVLNVPLVIVGLQGFSILSVFLLANMICVCAFVPITLGFFKIPVLESLHKDFIPVFCFIITITGVMIFAEFFYDDDGENDYKFGEGIKFAFWGNQLYKYEYFIFALCLTFFVTGVTYTTMHYLVKAKYVAPSQYEILNPENEDDKKTKDSVDSVVHAVKVSV